MPSSESSISLSRWHLPYIYTTDFSIDCASLRYDPLLSCTISCIIMLPLPCAYSTRILCNHMSVYLFSIHCSKSSIDLCCSSMHPPSSQVSTWLQDSMQMLQLRLFLSCLEFVLISSHLFLQHPSPIYMPAGGTFLVIVSMFRNMTFNVLIQMGLAAAPWPSYGPRIPLPMFDDTKT